MSTELITALFVEKLQAEAELGIILRREVPNSPVATQLRNRIATLEAQVEKQRQQMAGAQQDAGELASFLAELSGAETERLLAERLYRSASRNFDLAKSSTERQSTFASVFAPPVLPLTPTHPQRFALWLILVSCCLAGWGTVVLIFAAVDDHRS
jgi:capsular polysaccharide transport system permease protein